jgi:NTP pyrophosphatase (non-canonical NTP hydrolase)
VTTHDVTDDNYTAQKTWIPCQDSVYDDVMDSHDSLDFIGLLETLGFMAARYAHKQGFHDSQATHALDSNVTILSRFTKLMLMVTELAEVAEALRTANKHPDDLSYAQSAVIPEFTQEEEELADALIRLLDYAGTYRLRLAEATLAKMAYNKTREPMHGKKV